MHNNMRALRSWNLSVPWRFATGAQSVRVRTWAVSCSRSEGPCTAVCHRIIYVRIHDIMIPWAPGRRCYAERDREGNYRASCSVFLERGTRIRWNTSRVRRLSLFQFDRLIIIAQVRVGDVTVGMSEMSKERGVIMARVIAKLKKINADVWCTFHGGNGLNSSYSVCVLRLLAN